ncbi:MAG: hypothetical protein JWO02_510 [Solirubrobacterales bacterium]|nr:hypothetical protein [Solirubrobacterales bacterium]
MAADLELQSFVPHVGTTFTLHVGETTVPLELVAADAIPGDPADRGRPPFSLEFLGPADPAYAQATVALTHPALGTLEIFLVPIARDAAGTRYQAIFT